MSDFGTLEQDQHPVFDTNAASSDQIAQNIASILHRLQHLLQWSVARAEWLMIAGVALAAQFIFSPLVWQQVYFVGNADYFGHIEFAGLLLEKGTFSNSHPLFQFLIIALSKLLTVNLDAAAWGIGTAFYILAALLLYRMIRATVGGNGWLRWLSAGVIAIALLVVTPVTLFTMSSHNLYFGYIGINVDHNPTMVILKPLALVLFVFAVGILKHRVRLNPATLIFSVALVFLSLIAKPNFVMALLPALLLMAGYLLLRRDWQGLKTLTILLIVPMVMLLVVQYQFMFNTIDAGTDGVVIAPLVSVEHFEPSDTMIFVKFFLSIAFPLAVVLLYAKDALKSLPLNLGWLAFFAGAGQMYLLTETGDRAGNGNFWWGAQIALFILFVISALFWLTHLKDRPRWRALLCLGIFALHIYGGVVLYNVQFQTSDAFAWW